MMSAKTVTTEVPATQPGVTINLTSAPGPSGPTEFQSVLAGTAPELPLIDTLPTQSLVALLAGKQQQAERAATLAAQSAAVPVPAQAKPLAVTDILKLLSDTATVLPATEPSLNESEAGDGPTGREDTVEDSEDALRDWLDAMVPFGMFTPQAGSDPARSSEESADAGGFGGQASRQAPVTASLLPQAGIPEREAMNAAAATSAAAPAATIPLIGRNVELAASSSPFTAAVVALTTRSEVESDKPSADGWMSALGDLAAKRGADATPDRAIALNTPVHDSRWADAIAHRLVMMARDGESVAQLKLVPVDLGPLDIQITVKDSEASVHFGAAHSETRAALESSLPRLRELLSAQGLQLTNASVSQQSGGKNQPERSSGPAAVGAVTEDAEIAPAKSISTSLLDIYA